MSVCVGVLPVRSPLLCRPYTPKSTSLGNNGNAYVWGWNMYGQLGDNTKMNRTTPVMATMLAGVASIVVSTSYQHYMALNHDGNIWTCGYNTYCQLNIGTRNAINTDVPAQGEPLSVLINGQAHTAPAGGRLHLDHPHTRI